MVVPGEGEEKDWENKAKGEVLEQLYDENAGELDAEADEQTKRGWLTLLEFAQYAAMRGLCPRVWDVLRHMC